MEGAGIFYPLHLPLSRQHLHLPVAELRIALRVLTVASMQALRTLQDATYAYWIQK